MNDDLIQQQREHFNEISDKYFEGKQDKRFLELQRLLWKDLFKALPNNLKNKKIKVLEPMCGFTEGYKLLKKFGFDMDYTGFDFSDDVITKAREENPDLNIFHGDVTTFHSEEKYDLIIIIGGLHHVPDNAQDVVKNLSQMLSPGGVFINFEPTHNNPINKMVRDFIYKRNEIFDNETERGFHLKELNALFESSNLTLHHTFYPGLLAYIMYYNPYAFPTLNTGNVKAVQRLYNLEKIFYTNILGKLFSFATMSIWRKVD